MDSRGAVDKAASQRCSGRESQVGTAPRAVDDPAREFLVDAQSASGGEIPDTAREELCGSL
ncbi:hypothetical protein [Streptomyces phaeoluteigriseus]|uniref:hypothetical protein n=1 Tax=Streptomyces phaeoluteigriseus TaxID=114686 RepID=UPI00338F54E9